MPLNLIKVYNQLLDFAGMNEHSRIESLMKVFKRDFETDMVTFRSKNVYPTPNNEGKISMETLFRHLTTEMTNTKTRKREFEAERSKRLHWVRFHLNMKKKDGMYLFSVNESEGIRTYYYDIDEQYVLVLMPLRAENAYYLLTAYKVRGKDAKRNKIEKKYERRLDKLY